MSTSLEIPSDWTATDVVRRFGPIPIARLRAVHNGRPATVRDVSEIYDREKRLYELVDGLLMEKAMGSYESMIAADLIVIIGSYVHNHQLGKVLGESGMLRLNADMVRIPDVCYISNLRFAAVDMGEKIWQVVPDLVVEVLSDSNTAQEMERKRSDYFENGVRELWFIDAGLKTIEVFESPNQSKIIRATDVFRNSQVLKGLEFSTSRLFMRTAD